MHGEEPKQYLTIRQFAEQAGVSTQRIYQLLDKSLQSHFKEINGKKYISASALEIFRRTIPCDLREVTSPLQKVTAPLQEVKSTLQEVTSSLQEVASPLQETDNLLKRDLQGFSGSLQPLAKDLPRALQRGLQRGLQSPLQEVTGSLQEVDCSSQRVTSTSQKSEEIAKDAADTQTQLLKETIVILQQQLTVKDKQIESLTSALKLAQEQSETLAAALTTAQALHAGTIKERLTERVNAAAEERDTETDGRSPKEQKRKVFFSRIFHKR